MNLSWFLRRGYFRGAGTHIRIMKGPFLFTFILATNLWLSAGHAQAQIVGEHYLAGTEGIQAGSLPGPGIYIDDINWFGHLDGRNWNGGAVQNDQISSYVNEPRLRWMTKLKLLGANYGVELMVPWSYQEEHIIQEALQSFPTSPTQNPTTIPGFNYRYRQYELHDVEISPLLLGWHWQHFDLSAGYAIWVPTGDNSFSLIPPTPYNPSVYASPSQYHWWEHMLMLGGTWYPDAEKKWSVSALNHYEISQSFDSPIGNTQPGQLFTTEWGVSRKAGKYFDLGLVGNYSLQTTATRTTDYSFIESSSYSNIELGPEITATLPKYAFSASLRYLRGLSNPNGSGGSYDLNIVALTLSKGF